MYSITLLVYGKTAKSYNQLNGNAVILMKFSSLAAPKVVILTTFGAASDEDFIKMMSILFQWCIIFKACPE